MIGSLGWRECFLRALARVSVTLNASIVGPLSHALASSDDVLRQAVISSPFARHLFRLSTDPPTDRELAYSDYASFFYGITRVDSVHASDVVRRVVHYATHPFLATLGAGHHRPDYELADMGFSEGTPPAVIDTTVATNYLVKNLWHNVVHVTLQEIDESNFRDFRGMARESSDFVADTFSTALMALSYGKNVRADSLRDPASPDESIVHMLRCNRGNRIFAMRSDALGESDQAEEQDWRYRRSVAVYLSGWLLASGRAAASISVHFGREIPSLGPRIVVEVNGYFLSTPFSRLPPVTRASDTTERARFRNHLRQIAIYVDAHYRSALAGNLRRRGLADALLREQARCIGVAFTT